MSADPAAPRGVVHCADGVAVARTLEDESVDLVYLDPPFNTGRRQTREQLRTRRVPEGSEDGAGDRTGFGGRRYETERLGSRSFEDAYDDYLGFLEPFLVEAQRLLAPSGSLYLHLDYREVHYAKVLADRIFGRVNFVTRSSGPTTTARGRSGAGRRSTTTSSSTRRTPRATASTPRTSSASPTWRRASPAPRRRRAASCRPTLVAHDRQPDGQGEAGLPDAEAARRPRTHRARLLAAGRAGGGLVAGSGTTGEAALRHGRRFVLADDSPEALEVMRRRFATCEGVAFAEGIGG